MKAGVSSKGTEFELSVDNKIFSYLLILMDRAECLKFVFLLFIKIHYTSGRLNVESLT